MQATQINSIQRLLQLNLAPSLDDLCIKLLTFNTTAKLTHTSNHPHYNRTLFDQKLNFN